MNDRRASGRAMPNLTRRGFIVAGGAGALSFAAACGGDNKATRAVPGRRTRSV